MNAWANILIKNNLDNLDNSPFILVFLSITYFNACASLRRELTIQCNSCVIKYILQYKILFIFTLPLNLYGLQYGFDCNIYISSS